MDELPVMNKKEIQDVLLQIGMPANLRGFAYLTSAEQLVLDNPTELYKITGLYADVAHRHKTTVIRVERAIRHAVEVAWLRGNYDFLKELFKNSVNPTVGRPTNSQFIASLYFYLDNNRNK